jgi:hypothetical protein
MNRLTDPDRAVSTWIFQNRYRLPPRLLSVRSAPSALGYLKSSWEQGVPAGKIDRIAHDRPEPRGDPEEIW